MAATLANCKHPLQKDAGFLKVLQITRKCANFEARGMTAEKDMDGTKLKPLAGGGPTLKGQCYALPSRHFVLINVYVFQNFRPSSSNRPQSWPSCLHPSVKINLRSVKELFCRV